MELHGREMANEFSHNIQGSFTCCKSTTWDRQLYFPSEGRCAGDFFALKNPADLVGFEPANLGTRGLKNGWRYLICLNVYNFNASEKYAGI